MARDLASVVYDLQQQGRFRRILHNDEAQFGTENRRYLGATLLPERMVDENMYQEDNVRFRTLVANDGSRYSPAQLKQGGVLLGTFKVELGHQDIAVEMTGRDYDGVVKLLNRDMEFEAAAAATNWVDTTVNRALIERTEIQRWQAIVNGSVIRIGDNGYSETVSYPNPAGMRVAAGGAWSTASYDLWLDIIARAQYLWDKGYELNRIITSRRVVGMMLKNTALAARNNYVTVNASGQVTGTPGRMTLAELQNLFRADGLPVFETYDLLYQTQSGTGRFLPDTTMIFVATTGREETVDWGDNIQYVPETLGYEAIGTGVGQSSPGRAGWTQAHMDKPPRIASEGWQASLPVITEPEAFTVLTGIN